MNVSVTQATGRTLTWATSRSLTLLPDSVKRKEHQEIVVQCGLLHDSYVYIYIYIYIYITAGYTTDSRTLVLTAPLVVVR